MDNPPLSYNILKSNTSNDDMLFAVKDNFSYPLLTKSDDYVLSITRIQIPSAKVKSFIIADKYINDYTIAITSTQTSNEALINSPDANTFPNSAGTIQNGSNTEFVGVIEYYDPADVVNTLNAMIVNAYYKMVAKYGNHHEFGPQNVVFHGSANSYSHVHTLSLSKNERFAFAEFQLENLCITTSSTWPSFNVPKPAQLQENIKIILKNMTSGEEVILLSIPTADYVDWYTPDKDKFLIITDRAFKTLHRFDVNAITQKRNIVLPNETCFKLNDNHSVNGDWRITVRSHSTHFHGQIWYRLRLYAMEADHPTAPPSVSIVDNKLKLTYQPAYQLQKYQIAMSPKMNTMVNFTHYSTYDSVSKKYIFQFPQFEITSAMQALTQQRSSLNAMRNLSRIAVYSYAINVPSTELVNDSVNTNLLTDFIVENTNTQDDDGSYIYTAESFIWRYYEFNSSQPMHKLEMDVKAVYTDGTELDIVIPPGLAAMMRVSFFKRFL